MQKRSQAGARASQVSTRTDGWWRECWGSLSASVIILSVLHFSITPKIHLYRYSSTKKDQNKKFTSTVPIGNSACQRQALPRHQPTLEPSATLRANQRRLRQCSRAQREAALLSVYKVTRSSSKLQSCGKKH